MDPNIADSETPNLTPIYFDVEEGIRYYLPSLRNLIVGNFSWTDLNKQWNKKVNEKMVSVNGQNVKQMMTLLTLTVNAYKKQGVFEVQFLGFINHTIKLLISKMTPTELELIKGNLYDLLIYSDSFLDHLGEIFALAELVSNKPYRLLKSEFSLNEKGVPIDYHFTNTTTNEFINIEVYCIKLTQKNFDAGSKYDLGEFIKNKIAAKRVDKDKSGLDYELFPVLWLMNTDEKDYMSDLISYFRKNTIEIDKVITPYTILMGQDAEGIPITKFLPVSDFKHPIYQHF